MKDRFLNGLLAGIIGGIVGVAGGMISRAFGFSEMNAVEFTAMLLYGREVTMTSELIWASVAGVMFTGVFGIIFAHIILIIKSKYLYIKGTVFGFVTWYIWYSMILMTFTDQIAVITLSTSISNAANAMLYGITLSIAYNHLHKKELVDENKETLKAHNINVRKPLVTSKTYKVVTGQANELHQSHKRSIFERAINRILRRKKI